MLKISILTIGDEICIGQVLNSNAHWIAQQLTDLGCNIICHSTIEDDKHEIVGELNRLRKKSDIILMTGGLGPTHDDITKITLNEYFDDNLILHEPTFAFLDQIMSKRGIKMSDRIKSQALLPSHCIPLKNMMGTAPGMLFEYEGVYYISMPGVPIEMKHIFTTHIIPFINMIYKERNPKIVLHKTLNTVGISESVLAELIGDPKQFMPSGKLAFLPSTKGTRIRISIAAENPVLTRNRLESAKAVLYKKAGKFIISEDDVSFISTIANFLTKMQKTVSVAESCTGGLLGADFTSIPGSSKFFYGGIIAYDNIVKEKLLVIDKSLLENSGAVSEEVACAMAKNVRTIFKTDYGISITGVAGPDGGTDEKPVGTVWIGLAIKNEVYARHYVFSNERQINRERAVVNAEILLFQHLVSIIENNPKKK
jgi:nicotinamide-nucleotide amidase